MPRIRAVPIAVPVAVPVAAMLAGILLAALAGCDRQPGAGDTPLAIDVVSQPAYARVLAGATTAGLTSRDGRGNVVPGLAQSWRVANDGLSIVFRLREARFDTGQPIRAGDVAASIDAARRGDRGAGTASLLAGVAAARAPLANVVELELTTPQPELLELLATPALAVRPAGRRQTGIAAGPYAAEPGAKPDDKPGAKSGDKSGDKAPESVVDLTRNPHYYALDNLSAGHIRLRHEDPATAVGRFARNQTQLVLGGGLDGMAAARISARRQRLVIDVARAAWLLLVNQEHGKLADPGVRRALMLAIDRDRLGPQLFGTQLARPVAGIVPASIAGWPEYAPAWATIPLVARQEDARRLLHEAGVEAVGQRLTVQLLAGNGEGEARLATLVAGDFAAVGVDVILLRADDAQYHKRLAAGDFDLALVRRQSPIHSAIPFLDRLRCGHNRHGVCLPEADRHFAASWTAASFADRLATLAAAERLWADDGAAIGLVQPVDWALVSPEISGFESTAGVHPLSLLRVEPRRRLPFAGAS